MGQLEQVAQISVQSVFEYIQGWTLTNLSGQHLQLFDYSQSKSFLTFKHDLLHFSLCPLNFIMSLDTTENSGSVLFAASFQVLIDIVEIPLSFLFSRLNTQSSLNLSSQEMCSSLFIIFMALHWTLSSMSMSHVGELRTGHGTPSAASSVLRDHLSRPAGDVLLTAAQEAGGLLFCKDTLAG